MPGLVDGEGTLFPEITNRDDRLARIIALAAPAEDGSARPAFALVTNAEVLVRLGEKLAAAHLELCAPTQGDSAALAARHARAAHLHLLEQAALRAEELHATTELKQILATTVTAVRAEPSRQLRDFAFESLVGWEESKKLPAVAAARAALYPDRPPYEKWGKTIRIVRYVDNSGSLLSDAISSLKGMGFKHKANDDGSHVFTLKRAGAKHDIELTIPKVVDGRPNITEHVGDPNINVIEYSGHAGHGNFFENAFASTGATGDGQIIAAYQCWGEGNTETLERNCPDAQYLSTTASSSDTYDFIMQEAMYDGFLGEADWSGIMSPAIRTLKRYFSNDGEHDAKHWDSHFMAPNMRSILVKHYDRDGDGVPDEQDHIFNVIYPKRLDAAGGFDPVVQEVPRYALDGTALNKAVNQLSLLVRYNKLFPAAVESALPWKPEAWRPGGFFEPAAGDHHAFRFTRDADGFVAVALSTRFAHTHHEDLGRMVAVEAGYWLGAQADAAVRALPAGKRRELPAWLQGGVSEVGKAASALVLLERMAAANEQWFQDEQGLLDEAWAEEQLLCARYGFSDFTVGKLHALIQADIGADGDCKPEQTAKLCAELDRIQAASTWAARMPTAVGDALPLPDGLAIPRDGVYVDRDAMAALLGRAGIPGTVVAMQPDWIDPGQPFNAVLTVEAEGKRRVYGVGVDTAGKVLSLSKLKLDLTRKTEALLARVLTQVATTGHLSMAEVLDRQQARLAAGDSPLKAVLNVLREVRGKAAPGATVDPKPWSDLYYAGLLTAEENDEASAVTERLYATSQAEAEAETKTLAGLEAVAGPGKEALRKRYLESLAADAAPDSGADTAVTRALIAAIDTVPAARLKDADLVALSGQLLDGSWLQGDAAWKVLRHLSDRAGAGNGELILAALQQAIVYSQSELAGSEHLTAALQVARQALRAGNAPVDAALVAVERLRRSGQLRWGVEIEEVVKNATGVDVALEPAVSARLAVTKTRHEIEDQLFTFARDHGNCEAAARKAYYKSRDDHPAEADSAVRAWAQAVREAGAVRADDAELAELCGNAAWLDYGHGKELVLAMLRALEVRSDDVMVAAIERQGGATALRAFRDARRNHAGLVDAAAAALGRLAIDQPYTSFDSHPLAGFFDAEERLALSKRLQRSTRGRSLAVAAGNLSGDGVAPAVEKLRIELARGDDPVASMAKLLRGLSNLPVDQYRNLQLETLPVWMVAGERQQLFAAFVQVTGQNAVATVSLIIRDAVGSDPRGDAAIAAFSAKLATAPLAEAAAAALAAVGESDVAPALARALGAAGLISPEQVDATVDRYTMRSGALTDAVCSLFGTLCSGDDASLRQAGEQAKTAGAAAPLLDELAARLASALADARHPAGDGVVEALVALRGSLARPADREQVNRSVLAALGMNAEQLASAFVRRSLADGLWGTERERLLSVFDGTQGEGLLPLLHVLVAEAPLRSSWDVLLRSLEGSGLVPEGTARLVLGG